MSNKKIKKRDNIEDLAARKTEKAAQQAADQEAQAARREQLKPRGGFTYHELTLIAGELGAALNQLDGFAHRWCGYALREIKPFLKEHAEAVEKHKDHKNFQKERNEATATMGDGRRMLTRDKAEALTTKYKTYTEYVEKLLNSECEGLAIRPFKADWLEDAPTSAPLSRVLIDYDLLDDPAAIEAMLYGDDIKDKEE